MEWRRRELAVGERSAGNGRQRREGRRTWRLSMTAGPVRRVRSGGLYPGRVTGAADRVDAAGVTADGPATRRTAEDYPRPGVAPRRGRPLHDVLSILEGGPLPDPGFADDLEAVLDSRRRAIASPQPTLEVRSHSIFSAPGPTRASGLISQPMTSTSGHTTESLLQPPWRWAGALEPQMSPTSIESLGSLSRGSALVRLVSWQ